MHVWLPESQVDCFTVISDMYIYIHTYTYIYIQRKWDLVSENYRLGRRNREAGRWGRLYDTHREATVLLHLWSFTRLPWYSYSLSGFDSWALYIVRCVSHQANSLHGPEGQVYTETGFINPDSLLCTQRDVESYQKEINLMTFLYPLLIKHIRKLKRASQW